MSAIAETNSLFEIDAELDGLLDEIEEQAAQGIEPAEEIVARFQQFCSAHGEKVDRIGRFLLRMERGPSTSCWKGGSVMRCIG